MVASTAKHCSSLASILCVISLSTALPQPPRVILSHEQITTVSNEPTNTNLTRPSGFGVHCFEGSVIPTVTGPDCREALQHLRYARGIQVFSMHPVNGEKPVPFSWYGGSCEIRLGLLDPQARPADLEVPPQAIGEVASAVVKKCVTNNQSKQGGVTQLIVNQEYPSSWGVFVIRRGALPGGPVLVSPSNITRPPSNDRVVTDTGADLSRRASAASSESFNSPNQLETGSSANLSAPSSSSSMSPRCFTRQASPVPITIQDCWPAIHSMMTVDHEGLWHHPVRWGGVTGQPVPRVFFSETCKITVTSTARPAQAAVDYFSLQEAGEHVRWLIKSCRDFYGGYIGIGTSGAFFVEVEANGPGPLATTGQNSTVMDGASISTLAPLNMTATE